MLLRPAPARSRGGNGLRGPRVGPVATALLLLASALAVAPAAQGTALAAVSTERGSPGPRPIVTGATSTTGATGAGGTGGTTGAGSAGVQEGQPGADEVRAALDAARDARARADHRAGEVDAARSELTRLAVDAGLALERYRAAVLALHRARWRADEAQDRLASTSRQLRAAQEELGGWVRQAYSSGGVLLRSPTATTLLSGGALDDLDLGVVVLGHAGMSAHRALVEVERAQASQQDAARAAEASQQAASAATVDAATVRRRADTAVQAQRAAVDRLEADLTGARDAARAADRRASRLARARALADARAKAWRNRVTGPVGSCAGGDVARYANGTIPLSVLCPLWGAPGEYLRADAALAFGRLSQAYAADYGTPLCVTDSYRSYPEQVRIRAERPQLAAVPGTSNHGWGTAVDLCGGIESFVTPPHAWMLRNAPGYGWFHPAWAQAGGTLPEPWHWEFAG